MRQHFLPNGDTLTIRPAQEQDAQALLAMFRQAVEESAYLLTSPQEVKLLTLAQEREFIRSYLRNPNSLLLVAVTGLGPVGVLSVTQCRAGKQAHVGELGITVLRQHWNLGIGRRMVQTMLNWARDHPVIRLIQLGVCSTNEKALRLYSGFGFREKGRLEKVIRQPDGSYHDVVYMTLWTHKT